MADVPDLPDVMATDALLDQLAAGQQLEVDDPAAAPLATLTTLVQQPPLPEPSPALRAAAAAGRTLGALADRRFALRSLAAAAAVVGVVCTGGFSAAVTGDPLYPVRSIIDQVSPMSPGERGKIPSYLIDSDDEESTAQGAQQAPADTDTDTEPRLYPADDPTTSVAGPVSGTQPTEERANTVTSEGTGGQAAAEAQYGAGPSATSASGSEPAETGDSAETTSESVAGSEGTDSDTGSTGESESDTAGSDETGSDGTGSDGTGSDTSGDSGSDTGTDSGSDSGSDTGSDTGTDTTATTGDPGTGTGGSDGTESGDSGAGTTWSDGADTGSETDGSPTPGSAPDRDPLNKEVEGDLGAGADNGLPPCDDTATDTGATTDIGAGVCADPDGEPGVGTGNAVVPQKLGLTG